MPRGRPRKSSITTANPITSPEVKESKYFGLSRAEQETIIIFNKEDKIADVFTYEYTWQKHFEQKLGIQPYHDNGYGGKSYKVEKNKISKPRGKHTPKILTEEQRAKLRETLKRARASR